MKILIGYDGSEVADAAIDSLSLAGLPETADVLIVSIADDWLPRGRHADAQSLSARAVDRLKVMFPKWRIGTGATEGSPATEILRRARRFGADLIVLGEKNHSTIAPNMFLGSTSTKVLNGASSSVRVARAAVADRHRPVRILIGFDGSRGAADAVDEVCKRTWPRSSTATLLMIADENVLANVGRFAPQMSNSTVEARLVRQWAETLSESAMKKLRASGLIADLQIEPGYPKETLVVAADKLGVDEIFVGPNRSGNSFDRFLLGSVSAAVASRANCSVEVVRSHT